MRKNATPGSISWAPFLDMWARLENSPTISYRTDLGVVCFFMLFRFDSNIKL